MLKKQIGACFLLFLVSQGIDASRLDQSVFIDFIKGYIHHLFCIEKIRSPGFNGTVDLNHCVCRHPGHTR
jgi:hypothetical protein